MGWALRIYVKFDIRFSRLVVGPEFGAGIGVSIVAGRAAGGDLQADTMAGVENSARGPEIDFEWIDFSWCE